MRHARILLDGRELEISIDSNDRASLHPQVNPWM